MAQQNNMTKAPLKLLGNRVNRSYKGGYLLEQWQGIKNASDSDQPEEWLSSLVEARNSNPIPDEGLSVVLVGNVPWKLADLITKDPEHYLGKKHAEKYGPNMAVLTKMLDSSVRLSIQVHPTKSYSRKYFHSEYGKTEAWYIVGGREIAGEKPYVLAGFKPGITRESWKKYFEEQDINAMINSLHKFYIEPGDVVLIEGGFPHAIGEGCFLIEIQEPTDYTMRVERKSFDGSMLPDVLCHQGLGFEKMLDCFSYETLSYQETRNKCFKTPQIINYNNGSSLVRLISKEDTSCFSMDKVIINETGFINDPRFKTIIVLSGSGELRYGHEYLTIKQGETYFSPAWTDELVFENKGIQPLEIVVCYPPE